MAKRPLKTHTIYLESSASAANASGFLQIAFSQMPRPDVVV